MINYNPKVVTSGLVLCLDAANIKSFDSYENLYTYSEQLDHANWTKADSTIASNQTTAPDGTFTADKLIDNTNNNWHAVYQSINYAGNVTASIYAKYSNRQYLKFVTNNDNATDRGATFDLINKTVTNTSTGVTATIIDVGNGWVRVSVTSYSTGGGSRYYNWALATNSAGTYIYIGDGNGSVFLWGAQLEKSSTASRYYATTGTAKNRGASLTDISGNGKNATLTNGPIYNYLNNGILNFNGTNQYATCPHPTGSSYGITYEVFVKLNELTDNVILGFNNSTYFSGLSIISGTRFIGYLSGSNYKYFNNTTIQTGTWYHLVMYIGSSDAKDIKGYVNGVLDTTTTNHTGTAYTPTTLTIAASNGAATYWLGCDIGIIRCYDRELTAAEVLQNYNANRGRFGI